MRKFEIKGYVDSQGKQTRFETEVIAVDRSSAVRLATATYAGPSVKVYISDVKDHGPSKK